MPTYEYECVRCRHTFEVIQSFDDKPRSRCPECRGKLRKLLHPAGIIFRGGGWYATDSRASAEKDKFKSDGKKSEPASDEPVKKESKDPATSKSEPSAANTESSPDKSKSEGREAKSARAD